MILLVKIYESVQIVEQCLTILLMRVFLKVDHLVSQIKILREFLSFSRGVDFFLSLSTV